MRKRIKPSSVSLTRISPVVRLWMLRILVPLGTYKNIVEGFFSDEQIARTFGVQDLTEEAAVLAGLTQQLNKQELAVRRLAKKPTAIRKNVDKLAALAGLKEVECRIIEFAVYLQNESILQKTATDLGVLDFPKLVRSLSVILDLPSQAVRAALSPDGQLARAGLLTVAGRGTETLQHKLELLSSEFADAMTAPRSNIPGLIRDMVSAAPPGDLKIGDFPHLQSYLDVLLPYVRHVDQTARRGANILLHGASGTGKTQLTRAIAETLGFKVFEVAGEDAFGNSVDGQRRLRAFRAAQYFLAQRKTLIVFDEVEDVFNDSEGSFGDRRAAQSRKCWMNRMLETNQVPTFWLSNSVSVDPAILRRFDMIIEMPVPPRSQRERIMRANCSDLIDNNAISRIAEAGNLAPALITRAASVVRAIRDELGDEGTGKAFEQLVSGTLQAQGFAGLQPADPCRLPEVYDPTLIHSDLDLEALAKGLGQYPAARLCLYGPPGTGKTAYGRWLAEKLDKPLIVKRASDLMAPFIGETEKNLAEAFRSAIREKAILQIDEIDTFLQDRRGAQRSWEVGLVNEMLTQLEAFPGVLVATTNNLPVLDQAALRRFDLKIKFDYLNPKSALTLLQRQCNALGLASPQPFLAARITRLKTLTPGDFAAAIRQHRFRPLKSPLDLIEALERECGLKDDGRIAVGFL